MTNKTLLINLFQSYMSDAEGQMESDGFLPGLDVTNKAATELLNDIVLYGVEAELITIDTDETVEHSTINWD